GYSWVIGKPGESNYRFRVTWAPGNLFLSGDLGEETWTHYHAMPELWAAIFWFGGSSYDYLVGKCTAEQVFDRDRTVEHILESAYRSIRDSWTGLSWIPAARSHKRYGSGSSTYFRSEPVECPQQAETLKKICDYYDEDWTSRQGRKDALRSF